MEPEAASGGGARSPRVISDCHFTVHLNHFIPGLIPSGFSGCFSRVTIGYNPTLAAENQEVVGLVGDDLAAWDESQYIFAHFDGE